MNQPARRHLPTVLVVLGYALVCAIWGTNWVAIKLAVTGMPPLLAAGLRFVFAAPVLLTICRLAGKPIFVRRAQVPYLVFVTLNYFTLPYLFLNLAEQHISSGLTAICFSMISLLIVVLGVPILGARIGLGEGLGVVVSFVALVLLLSRSTEISAGNRWAVAGALLAAAMHALSYVLIKRYGADVHTLTLNSLPVAAAGILLVLASLAFEHPSVADISATSLLATLHLALVASVIGLVVYFALLQRLSALTMSFVFVIFPLLAQVLSQVVDGTRMSGTELVLILAIVSAMACTLRLHHRRSADRAWRPTASQLRQMYADALSRYPEEACGYCLTDEVRPCSNVLAVPSPANAVSQRSAATGYAFGSADLLELARSLDSPDPARLIYHSHPDVGAYLSEEDLHFAVQDGTATFPVLHLVIDAREDGVHGARLYEFSVARGTYVEAQAYEAAE
ncbi:MAG: EamA family transporter [Nocardioidaceae bacterium]|nr:EamA family transporter [Nocardioidaceae bacterium]